MASVIAFDLYGTVFDLGGVATFLAPVVGARADALARLWREKQIELSFRRALMRQYIDFDTCTAHALTSASHQLGLTLEDGVRDLLVCGYQRLPAFPDAEPALASLASAGYTIVALTNATSRSATALLTASGLLAFFRTIITVDAIGTFKPDPAVYAHLVESVGAPKERVWLVSGNAWDVMGAKAYGLRAVWLARDGSRRFDPGEWSPDVMIESLAQLRDHLPQD
jgi:2-haloacid dehalogenase